MALHLEEALVALAESLEFPGEDELADRVTAALASPRQPAPVVPLLRRPAVRRALAVLAAAAVLAGVVLVGSPGARRAVADLLGIGGIEIRSSASTTPAGAGSTTLPATFPTTPATTPAPRPGPGVGGPAALVLGEPVTVEAGAARVGIPVPVPASLGAPAATYLGTPPASGRLSLVWSPGPTLPATALPEVGALLTVFRARADEGLFQKVLDPGTTYERVTVNGQPAAWLSGEPHTFLYVAESGSIQEEELRLAGDTLIWTAGPHTYRLESALERDTAIAVAESVPVG